MKFKLNLTVLLLFCAFFAVAQKSVMTPQIAYDNVLSVRRMSNNPAPAFSATTLGGKAFNIEQLKGSIVVLTVWNTNCAPCINEINSFKDIKKTYDSKKVSFIAAAPTDDIKDIKSFLKAHEFTFDIIYSPSSNFVKDYTATSYPTNYVIDREGIVRYSEIGYREDNVQEIMSIINKYL